MRKTLRRNAGDTHAPRIPGQFDGDEVWTQEHTRQRFHDALDAFQGTESRLQRLAEAADARAVALHQAHESQLALRPEDLSLPHAPVELRRDASRQPVGAWRYLDDAFAVLTEISRDDDASLLEHASAFMDISSASRAVAEELAAKQYAGSESVCSFCGEHAADGRQTIVAERAVICAQCVDVCSDLIARQQRRGSGRRRLLAR